MISNMFQVNPLTRCWLYPGYIRATITLITPPFLLLNVGDIPIVSHSVPIYLHHVPITPAFFVGLTPLKTSSCIRHPTSRPQAFDFEVPIPPAPAQLRVAALTPTTRVGPDVVTVKGRIKATDDAFKALGRKDDDRDLGIGGKNMKKPFQNFFLRPMRKRKIKKV